MERFLFKLHMYESRNYFIEVIVENRLDFVSWQIWDALDSVFKWLLELILCFNIFQLMECCVNALVTSFKETILAECQGMIKRNETESKWSFKSSAGWTLHELHKNRFVCRYIKLLVLIDGGSVPYKILLHMNNPTKITIDSYFFLSLLISVYIIL